MKCYVALAILLVFINFINSTLFDDETSSCIKIKPIRDSDCYLQNYTTLTCCSINLTYPEVNSLCIGMPTNAKGLIGVVDNILVPNITISGNYNCSGNTQTTLNILYVIILLIIF